MSAPPQDDERPQDELRALAERVSALEAKVQRLLGGPPLPEPEAEAPAAVASPAEATPPIEPPARVRRDWAWLEQVAGRQWLTWAGVLALFLATGFFVKYAIDRGWLGPGSRVVLGLAAGVVMVGGGHLAVHRRLTALGQGLMGGGVAILYLSLYASFTLYHLVPQSVAFGGMVLVTAGGLALSVGHDAVALSFLAMLGGLLTPVLLSTGTDARDALFGYILLLDVGTLAIALFKNWRGLDAVAFIGTVVLYGGWFDKFYSPAALGPAFAWLAAFYLVFLLLPFAHHLRRATPIAGERFVMALANATFVLWFAYHMLWQTRQHSLGFLCLGMAACYTLLGWRTRRRVPADRRALFAFAALAVFCLTLSVPLYLKFGAITMTWAAEASVLLYLGYQYRFGPLRGLGFMVLLVALGRMLLIDTPLHIAPFALFANREFLTALSVPVAAGVFAVIHDQWRGESTGSDRELKLMAAIGAGLLALGLVHAELSQWYHFSSDPAIGRSVIVLVWTAGAVVFMLAGLWTRSLACRMAALAPLAFAAALAPWQYQGVHHVLVLNLRFGTALAAVLAVFACGLLLRRSRRAMDAADGIVAAVLPWLGLGLLLALLSVEPYRYWRDTVADHDMARWLAQASVSVVWAAYAAAMLVVGFWRRSLALRLAALGLFGATALKLVLVDISGVERIYRVVAFLVLGLLMVGGAYLYNRVERRLGEQQGPDGKAAGRLTP